MTFASGSAEAVGKFNKAPSARATASFRESLARKLGGSAEEGEFSAALLTDGAVVQVAGSAVLAGGLIRDCDWAAGDLDVWSPALWKSGRCELEGDHALGTGAGYRKPPFRCVTAFLNKSWGAVAPSARALAGAKRSAAAAELPEASEEPVQAAEVTDGYALDHVGWDGPVPFESSMVHAVTVRSNM